MEKKKGGRKSWHVSTLVRHALNHKSVLNLKRDDAYWDSVYELTSRGSIDVFQAAEKNSGSSKIRERVFGADLLGQLGVKDCPFSVESLNILHKMLNTESSPRVLRSVLVAIGHAQESEVTRGTKTMAAFRDHRSADVRFGVVMGLMGRTNPISVNALLHLSRDKASKVRDWATFGLGAMIELDTPAIRKALFERLDDNDCDTRCEALVGLAKRKDLGVKPALILELEKENVTSLVFQAAEELGDKSLLPLLERQIASADAMTDEGWLDDAQFSKEQLEKMD